MQKKCNNFKIKGVWLGLDNNYFQVIHALRKARKDMVDPHVLIEIDDESLLRKINIPSGLMDVAKELNISLHDLITRVLADFLIQWKYPVNTSMKKGETK